MAPSRSVLMPGASSSTSVASSLQAPVSGKVIASPILKRPDLSDGCKDTTDLGPQISYKNSHKSNVGKADGGSDNMSLASFAGLAPSKRAQKRESSPAASPTTGSVGVPASSSRQLATGVATPSVPMKEVAPSAHADMQQQAQDASQPIVVALDVDEVLVCYVDGFRKYLEQQRPEGPLDMDSVFHEAHSPHSRWRHQFALSGGLDHLEPVPGAFEAVCRLRAAGIRLEAVTSRPPIMRQSTEALLMKLFPKGSFSAAHFTGPGEKGIACNLINAKALVDDQLPNCVDAANVGVTCILFDYLGGYRWSKTPQDLPPCVHRIDTWEEACDFLLKRLVGGSSYGVSSESPPASDPHVRSMDVAEKLSTADSLAHLSAPVPPTHGMSGTTQRDEHPALPRPALSAVAPLQPRKPMEPWSNMQDRLIPHVAEQAKAKPEDEVSRPRRSPNSNAIGLNRETEAVAKFGTTRTDAGVNDDRLSGIPRVVQPPVRSISGSENMAPVRRAHMPPARAHTPPASRQFARSDDVMARKDESWREQVPGAVRRAEELSTGSAATSASQCIVT